MANVITAAKSLSTTVVKPQDRNLPSDVVKSVALTCDGGADQVFSFATGRIFTVVAARVLNGAVLQDTATNTTAVTIDQYDNDATTPAKVGTTIATKAAATAIKANGWLELTVTATSAQIPATNSVRALFDVTGTQGAVTLVLDYIEETVKQYDNVF